MENTESRLYFASDYMEGAHPAIMKKLMETNLEKTVGYGQDPYTEDAKEKIREHLKEDPLITIAQVRDMFATSRKSAKPILEYMDSIKVTKKTGAESERVAY